MAKECSTFQAFTTADPPKPVFHIEYPNSNGNNPGSHQPVSDTTGWCKTETEDGDTYDISNFSTVIKDMDLDGWVELCNTTTAITPTTSIS